MPFLSVNKDGFVEIHVYVQPRASKTRIMGLYDGLLKIGVTSPPVDGQANREVVQLLAKVLKIPKSGIVLKTGAQSRRKTLGIAVLKNDEVRRSVDSFLY